MQIFFLKRKIVIIIGVIFLAKILLTTAMVISRTSPTLNLFENKPVVVIDAGHGGVDKGTSRGDILEKDITLDVSLRIGEYLGEQGIAVGFTRTEDVDLGGERKKGRHRKDLEARVKTINTGKLGVSIHVNSGGHEGASVYYLRDNEAAKELGELLLDEIKKVQVLDYDFPVPRSNLYILKNSEVPTVLIEIGFITNPTDRQKISNPQWRQQMAESIGDAILRYIASN